MTFLAYLFILSVIFFIGAMVASMKSTDEKQKYYGTMFASILFMAFAGLGMAFGVLGLLPELSWQ